MIDDLTISKIKDAANIVDVIGDFYELRKAGTEYECKCPFHEDRHLGSFKISPRKNFAKCFSCGWQGGPIDFVMQHERLSFADAIRWLGKKYSIEVEGSDGFEVKPSVPRQQLPPLPTLLLPMEMVTYSERNREANNLVMWLRSIPWDSVQRRRLDEALEAYHVGHARNGMAMFWQIDDALRVHTGKMMLYKADGHRDREARYGFDWIHAALYRSQHTHYSPEHTDAKPCLFGLHLLDRYFAPNVKQEVCIVESEKTALLMATAYGNTCKQVWMACGGLESLNREKLKPIIAQGRHIRLYPDRDAIDRWKLKAEQLRYDRVLVDAKPVTEWWRPEDGDKADIGDVVVRIINHRAGKQATTPLSELPAVKLLRDKLNAKIIDKNDR